MSGAATILITRPMPVAKIYAQELEALGFEALCAPMLEVCEEAFELPDLDGFQGLIFTSAQGVRTFSARADRRDVAVYCVGTNTADAARECGFADVCSAEGSAGDLLPLVQRRAQAGDRFLHVRGRDVARDIVPEFLAAGFEVVPLVVYCADMLAGIDADIMAAIKAGAVDAVVFFSKRTAENFMTIVEREGAAADLRGIKALCISAGVVECVRVRSWADVQEAPQADRRGMLTLLQNL